MADLYPTQTTTQLLIDAAASTRHDDMDASEATVLASFALVAQASERMLHDRVGAARRMGMTWAEIGAVLGTTRQAAQQRYGRGLSAPRR